MTLTCGRLVMCRWKQQHLEKFGAPFDVERYVRLTPPPSRPSYISGRKHTRCRWSSAGGGGTTSGKLLCPGSASSPSRPTPPNGFTPSCFSSPARSCPRGDSPSGLIPLSTRPWPLGSFALWYVRPCLRWGEGFSGGGLKAPLVRGVVCVCV
jgi:hypothetical protein